MLRGKTIECISLIGLAVGTEKFSADASEVMEMLLKTQTGDTELSDDDPQVHSQYPVVRNLGHVFCHILASTNSAIDIGHGNAKKSKLVTTPTRRRATVVFCFLPFSTEGTKNC